VLASGHGGSVFLWDASTYSLIKRLYNYGTNEVFSVAFTPGGDTVVANADGGSLQLWDVSSWSLLGTYNGGNFSNLRIDISPDGKYIATGDRLRLLRVADGSVVRNLSSTEYSYSPVFSPSGNVIAFVEQDTLKLMNVADGTLLQGIREIDYCRDPVFDATGDRITAAGRQDGTVNVWQTATGALWLRIENGSISHSVAFSPLNNIIATGDWHGTVRVWGLSGAWAIDP
jgi:WD40 repeat protein